ncbi:erythrocyte membrane protein 1 [Plasmodium falciparum IGH-CR14]|uniref:Erythrocyte membrane protein 1 n=1 Tax=Plasmodium falciparum IGH-CR14 TaxID=580059 RepID=A0A0L1I4R5_PLAFA|nr:erythrocyte membrane protein 1 [Plasmodium falciparum IGH-CR14]
MASAAKVGGSPQEEKDKYDDAKDLLDKIGQQVHDKVKEEAKRRSNGDLKGSLTNATFFVGETASSLDPCILESEYTKLISGSGGSLASGVAPRGHPCKKDTNGNDVDRFSKESGGECDEKKIKDNKGKEGACAPYRRLSLCNKNFQKINNYSSNAKHNLLLEVCMAAKYEGESLKNYHAQYQEKYPGSSFTMCTMLARSFADIGDIVRGRDLYFGKRKKKKQNGKETETERDQLESKLKEIFAKIHSEVTSGKNKKDAKDHYKGDADNNYFQLREDWWNANRETVWKAMTCSEHLKNSAYFRVTCNDNETLSQANDKCRCKDKKGRPDDQVPTYFDYVPQYLRWFEEWAEDFCRLRKRKLQNAKEQCRGKTKGEKYCSGNGFDCTQTIRALHIYSMENNCHKCFFACSPFVKWLDNQKLEFDKQKQKYNIEINGRNMSQNVSSANSNYQYENQFYEILKENYGDVNKFLKLLSKERACQKHPEVEGKEFFDFADEDTGTKFSRTQYCEPCPECGVNCNGSTCSERERKDGNCPSIYKIYNPNPNDPSTDITILKSGEGEKDIAEKLDAFCTNSNDNSLYEKWKCYQIGELTKDGQEGEVDVKLKDAGGLCILEKTNGKENGKKQKTFNDFFRFWVTHMLDDSMEWKEKLKGCLKNGTKIKCKNGCKNPCECYESWVEEKKNEWDPIKDHFYTQDFGSNELLGDIPPYYVIETVLEEDFFKGISNAYNDPEQMEKIRKKLEKKKQERDEDPSKKETIIDYLLDHELEEAKECTSTHNDANCNKQKQQQQKQAASDPARSDVQPGGPQPPGPIGSTGGEESEEEEEEEEEEEHDDDGDEVEEEKEEEHGPDGGDGAEEKEDKDDGAVEGSAPQGPQGPKVEDICKTVAEALKGNLNDACRQKYGGNNSRLGWKCISDKTATRDGEKATSDGEKATSRTTRDTASVDTTTGGKDGATGSICVPPRRRRLYVGELTKWADKQVETQVAEPQESGNTVVSGDSSQANGVSTSTTESSLLHAFVKSAAVETFFLWDRYKKIKEKEKKEKEEAENHLVASETSDDPEQKELNEGNIPEEFKRQMFYTLGDYRDIVVRGVADDKNGGNNIVVNASGNKEDMEKMNKIQQKITDMLNKTNSGSTPRSAQNGFQQRQNLWSTFAPSIWKGMICALTYKEEKGENAKIEQNNDLKEKLWDDKTNEPKKHKYESVTIGASGTEAMSNDDTTSPTSPQANGSISLADFTSRPPYFRYLEEWGETFCRQRTRMLEQIKVDCEVDDSGNRGCSGDGLKCKEKVPDNKDIFNDFNCPSCADSCRSYRKWIDIKKKEFDKQKSAYEQQKTDATSNNNGNEFSTKLQSLHDAGDFLNRLKNGPCKKDNDNGNNSGEDEINFKDDDSETFQHTNLCDPCSKFRIKCENANCTGSTKVKCNGRTDITQDDIENKTDVNNIVMLVSDNSTKQFEGEGLNEACKNANIFKGIREDVWECGKVCGVDICTLKKDKNGKESGKKYIIMKELLQRWLEYFFEDYNRIHKKLKPCIENGKGTKCIKDCVDKWITKKKEEWQKINDKYLDQYTKENPEGVCLCVCIYIYKKTKSSVGNLFQILQIPKSDYDIPTKLSPNRYIPYTSGKYRGKRYIYLEGDSGTDSGYTDHYSDITSSSESEYEELDINDIYVPRAPKYKTLIEVVLEPSGKLSGNTIPTSGNNTTASDTQNDIQNDGIPSSKITDNEWNTLKDDFISQYLQSEQPNGVPNDYTSGDIPFNTQPNTLYFDNNQEKPFITSIHDRNLYSGEEYNYDMSTNSGNNDLYNGKNNLYSGENNVYGGIDPTSDNRGLTSGKHDSYSGIDLINDSLSGEPINIYDELLKRKENELYGTNHVKQTSIHSVAKPARDDPIHNQLELFHTWLDRHRDMCEKWENHHERLAKLKEEWENKTHSGDINSGIPSGNHVLNTDVSIQIHMDNPKPTNEFTYVDSNPNQVDDTYVDSNPDNSSMDTILEDLEKYKEPYYDVQDDIYYDVNDHDTSTVDSNAMDIPSKVQIEMDVNTKLVKEKYPISDVWDI